MKIILGELFEGNKSKFFFTPSFGAGIYDDGSGKKLGNDLQFRTSFEVSYELKNKNRIGISFSHISNANLGDKNPGVEILKFFLSYTLLKNLTYIFSLTNFINKSSIKLIF